MNKTQKKERNENLYKAILSLRTLDECMRFFDDLCTAPELIAMDEISEPEDAGACRSAAYCGVSLLATAHAADAEELSRRDVYQRLLRDRVFFRAIVIRCADGCRSYEEVML